VVKISGSGRFAKDHPHPENDRSSISEQEEQKKKEEKSSMFCGTAGIDSFFHPLKQQPTQQNCQNDHPVNAGFLFHAGRQFKPIQGAFVPPHCPLSFIFAATKKQQKR